MAHGIWDLICVVIVGYKNIPWQLFWWVFNISTVGDRLKPLSFEMSILKYVIVGLDDKR